MKKWEIAILAIFLLITVGSLITYLYRYLNRRKKAPKQKPYSNGVAGHTNPSFVVNMSPDGAAIISPLPPDDATIISPLPPGGSTDSDQILYCEYSNKDLTNLVRYKSSESIPTVCNFHQGALYPYQDLDEKSIASLVSVYTVDEEFRDRWQHYGYYEMPWTLNWKETAL